MSENQKNTSPLSTATADCIAENNLLFQRLQADFNKNFSPRLITNPQTKPEQFEDNQTSEETNEQGS